MREAGITHFVDDRLDVLGHLESVDHRYLFLGGLGHHEPPDQFPQWATAIDSWPRLVGLLSRDIGTRSR